MARSPGQPIRVEITSSHGTLAVDPVTGLVDEARSTYDGDELSDIVKFDVEEWETIYRRIFAGGDILDYAYWSRDTDPASSTWGRWTVYSPPVYEMRKAWRNEFPERAAGFEEFDMYPCLLLDATRKPVSYDDPRGTGYERAMLEDDPKIACWSVYGFTEDERWQCLSDHRNKKDAQWQLRKWREAKQKYDNANIPTH